MIRRARRPRDWRIVHQVCAWALGYPDDRMLEQIPLLRRALDSFPAEARATAEPHVAALIEGVELTERDFLSRLARFGVKKMEAQGARFDPNQHEALFEIPDESQPAGTVAQVIEPGYSIGERVLRPAKVGVTRGGPKA